MPRSGSGSEDCLAGGRSLVRHECTESLTHVFLSSCLSLHSPGTPLTHRTCVLNAAAEPCRRCCAKRWRQRWIGCRMRALQFLLNLTFLPAGASQGAGGKGGASGGSVTEEDQGFYQNLLNPRYVNSVGAAQGSGGEGGAAGWQRDGGGPRLLPPGVPVAGGGAGQRRRRRFPQVLRHPVGAGCGCAFIKPLLWALHSMVLAGWRVLECVPTAICAFVPHHVLHMSTQHVSHMWHPLLR